MVRIALAVLLLSACAGDDGGGHDLPLVATGTVELGSGVSETGFLFLALRLELPGNTVALNPSLPLAYPYSFTIGPGGIGPVGDFVVRAWLSRSMAETEPATDAPRAERTIMCEGSCTPEAMLVLTP